MVYGDAEPPSHLQFKRFKENADPDITDRILPVESHSKLGRMFIDESHRWSEKMNDPRLKIEFLPTFLDFKTHEILLVGFHNVEYLRELMDSRSKGVQR